MMAWMQDETWRRAILIAWAGLAIVSAVVLRRLRLLPLSERGSDRLVGLLGYMDKRTAWIVMESPILVAVLAGVLTGTRWRGPAGAIVGAFVLHYVHRALIYPWRIRVQGRRMPRLTVLAVMLFYIVNGGMVGIWFGHYAAYPPDWWWDPRFLLGALLFVCGAAINIHSDNILIHLRRPGEQGYRIPQGGLFRYVSCPHYLGEIIEWTGFALMSWSPVGCVYALWVIAPLVAQALESHRWYRQTFGDDYPAERRALIPGLL